MCFFVCLCRLGRASVWQRLSRDTDSLSSSSSSSYRTVDTDLRANLDRKRRWRWRGVTWHWWGTCHRWHIVGKWVTESDRSKQHYRLHADTLILESGRHFCTFVHRRRSSVNFGGAKHFCPKIYTWKINKMPEFYMTSARKINKIPEFYMIYARKINKMSEFYTIFARKNSFCPNLGGNCPPWPPVSYAYVFSSSESYDVFE